MLRWLLLCAVVALVRAQSTPVSHCTEAAGELPYNTYVNGCTVTPCRVRRGDFVVVNLIFRAPYLMQSMRSLAFAAVPGLPGMTPWDLEGDALTCNFLTNSYCPILAGEVLQYTLRMRIPIFTPPVTVTVEFVITDDRGEESNNIMCVRIPVTVFW